MARTRWPRVEAAILRHLARRRAPTTAAAVAEGTGLPEGDVTYALEALYEAGRVETRVEEGTRRWWLPGDAGDGPEA
ncbi:MAG: helix-turn-helix domain-containing protein [Haloferacaceae archaeon]